MHLSIVNTWLYCSVHTKFYANTELLMHFPACRWLQCCVFYKMCSGQKYFFSLETKIRSTAVFNYNKKVLVYVNLNEKNPLDVFHVHLKWLHLRSHNPFGINFLYFHEK